MSSVLNIKSVSPVSGVNKSRNLKAELAYRKANSHVSEADIYGHLIDLYDDIHLYDIEGFSILPDGNVSEEERRRRFEGVISLSISMTRSHQATQLLQQYKLDVTKQSTLNVLQKQLAGNAQMMSV
jgi:hypothetical protein